MFEGGVTTYKINVFVCVCVFLSPVTTFGCKAVVFYVYINNG